MPATWHRAPMAAFDLETTGVDVETDRVVTATIASIEPGRETAVSSWLAAVEIDIPAGATAVHGITTEHARANGKPPSEVLDVLAGDLATVLSRDVPVVGMNLAYDLTLLDRELRRHQLPTLPERLGRAIAPVIDVRVLDKHIEQYRRGTRKLTDLCAVYAVQIDGAHDATFDAIAAARIAWRIGRLTELSVDDLCTVFADRSRPTELAMRVQEIGRMSLAELHAAQIVWFAQQCDGLRANFDKRGVAHDGVPGDWPMRPWSQVNAGREATT